MEMPSLLSSLCCDVVINTKENTTSNVIWLCFYNQHMSVPSPAGSAACEPRLFLSEHISLVLWFRLSRCGRVAAVKKVRKRKTGTNIGLYLPLKEYVQAQSAAGSVKFA